MEIVFRSWYPNLPWAINYLHGLDRPNEIDYQLSIRNLDGLYFQELRVARVGTIRDSLIKINLKSERIEEL